MHIQAHCSTAALVSDGVENWRGEGVAKGSSLQMPIGAAAAATAGLTNTLQSLHPLLLPYSVPLLVPLFSFSCATPHATSLISFASCVTRLCWHSKKRGKNLITMPGLAWPPLHLNFTCGTNESHCQH